MPKSLTFAVALSMLLATTHAWAQPNYPTVIQDHLQAVRKPPCKVCHAEGQTGFGTVSTPFGLNMLTVGVRAFDEQSVRAGLDTSATFKTISNKARKAPTDIEVLRLGGDPNEEAPVYYVADPEYGCGGATIAGRVRTSLPGVLLVGGLALLVLRRRRSAR